MAAAQNLTTTDSIVVSPREIDFVTRFDRNWEALRNIMGVSRPIKKAAGTTLKSKIVTVELAESPAEGNLIPYSEVNVTEKPWGEMKLEKYAKGVSAEAIEANGYEVAIQKTDDEFLFELTSNVTSRFYEYLNTGTLEAESKPATFQMAIAMAKGLVVNKFKKMHRTATKVVAFVNVLDAYEYLGAAGITVQNQFGIDYIKDFMGMDTIFLLSEDEVARGTVLATPVENIVMYYVDPSESDFAKAGLNYTVQGETNLIGFHTQGNYGTAVSECFALMGINLFAEYIDAIANIEFGA